MPKRLALVLAVLASLAACQPTPTDEPAPQFTDAGRLAGSYRLKATPDEVAEAGGLDKLPLLVLDKGFFRIVIDGEESSGAWSLQNGKLTLTDKATKESNSFSVSKDGTELMEESNDPVVFVKVGVEPPPKAAK